MDTLFKTIKSRFEWRADELGKEVVTVDARGLRVDGDRLRLEQAVGNLVDNALRHGGGRVTMRADSVDGRVELHVRDDGAGFPDEYLERAFDRFARPDAARAGGGAGLGLSIVKTIAESHGGSAHVTNVAEGSADAWVSIPA